MNILVRYYTRTGNTQKLGESIAEVIGTQAKSIDVNLETKAEILFLGCSYYAFDIDENVKRFISENKDNIGKIVCFGTSAILGSTRKKVNKVAEEVGVNVADEEFHCYGTFGLMHKGRPNEKDLEDVAEFAKKIRG